MAHPFQSLGLFGRPSGRSPHRPRRPRRAMRWFWRNPPKAARAQTGHERLVFDPLEPRLLLNADVLTVSLAQDNPAQPIDHSIIVQMVQQTEQVNNQAVSVQQVQVVDKSNGNAVLAFGDLNEISAISIAGGAGNTSVTIDASSFAGQKAPAISFEGGNGQNTVIFDNTTATNWSLTGANAGTVSGGGVNLSFQNVANLTGAANNNDTLTVEQGGTLSGVFDGGAGASNSVVFDNGSHQAAAVSVGPHYDTVALDGQALNYADVQSLAIGDPGSVSFVGDASSDVIDLSQSGGTLTFTDTNSSDSSFSLTGVTPTANTPGHTTPFEVTLGSGNTLDIDGTVNFTSYDTGLNIDGGGAKVEITNGGHLVVPDGLTISAGSIDVDASGSITGSTISLEAQATDGSTITASSTDTSKVINTTDAATVDIEGSITATASLDITSTVTVTDSITAADSNSGAPDIHTVTVTANDLSTVTFGSASVVSAPVINAQAETSVSINITLDHIGTSLLAAYLPTQITGEAVTVTTDVTNVTMVTVDAGASLKALTGAGTIALGATDSTNIDTDLTLDPSTNLPVVGGVLVFSALDSPDTLSRTTEVDVGNLTATAIPTSGPDELDAIGDVTLTASSGGMITDSETSDALGTVTINAGSTDGEVTYDSAHHTYDLPGDVTAVNVTGAVVSALGLSLATDADSTYAVSGHISSVSVGGEADALAGYDSVTTGADGFVVSTEDDSTLSSTSVSPDFDSSGDANSATPSSGTTISLSYTTSQNTFDQDVVAIITHSTVTSTGGVVRVQAVNNTTLTSDAVMSVDAETTGKTAASGGGMLAANSVQGIVSASIEGSTVTTTGGAADVQVLAGDTSTITARAETSALASGGGNSAAVGATIALNTIGWQLSGNLLTATVDTILGTSGWTDDSAANSTPTANGATTTDVTAKIVNSTITAGGALMLKALADGTVAATVTNVSQASSEADGNARSLAIGGVVASNRISRAATAYLSNVVPPSSPLNTPLAGGAITIDAENNASITSTSTLVTSAVAVSAGAKTTHVSTDAPGNADSTTTALKPTTTLQFGDTVLFKATYNTANIFGVSTPKMVTINPGDTVEISPNFPSADGALDSVYEYTGTAPASIDLEQQNYTTGDWTLVSATNNTVYKFMGPSGTNVDLSTGALFDADGNAITTVTPGYFDLGYWAPVPAAELQPSTDDDGHSTSGSASGAAVGGIVVVNEVHGGANAVVQSSTVSGASLAVTALDNAAITATTNATATASGGSSFGGSSTTIAVNGSISINEILGDADAHIVDSTVTTTGDVDVTATNSADIQASTMSAVSVTGTGTGVAVGVILADNTIGADFQDLLDSTVDTIAGGNVLGTSAPTETTAYIQDSSVDAGGALTVQSTSTETVNAAVGNTTLADVQPSDSSKSYSAGAVLSDNQILTSVTAYIDNGNSTGHEPAAATVGSAGATTVSATDTATITTSTTMTALGTPAATGPANDYASLAMSSYKYTDKSTNADNKITLNFGDQVAVQDPTTGSIVVYRYLGTTQHDVDLSALTDSTTPASFTDLDYWKPMSADQLKEEAEAQSANPKSGDDQGGTPGESVKNKDTSEPSSGSASLYVLFDYNNVASSTAAFITNATVTGGTGVAITASDTATITATDGSVVTTSDGGFGAGGVVATNHVTGSAIPSDPDIPLDAATAFISNATVTATTGDVTLDAQSNGTITATETTALTADGNAVSIEAAFNVIGWSNDNFGSLALAALIGTDQLLGTATPYATEAFITDGSTVVAGGNVSVTASGEATITATVGDQASAGNPDASATLNVGGILATNKIDTATDAYIGTAAPTAQTVTATLDTSSVTATGGTVTVSATDAPTLTATSTITLSSTASTGGVAGALSGDYSYTEKSGTQTLHKGDKVRVQTSPGATPIVYTYQGTDNTPSSGDSVDLTNTSQYSNTNLWKAGDDGSASTDSPAAESKAIGFNFVLNDVRGNAEATIAVAAIVAGGAGISVSSNEAASIEADTESNLTSTGGGNGSQSSTGGSKAPDANTTDDASNQPKDGQSTTTPGGGLALGGAVVTNLVLAQSQASIQGATLSAGTDGIKVDAQDTAQLDAKTLVASSTGGAGSQKDFDLSIAFNSIGYAPENFLFNAVDALLGSDYLSNPTPDNATAYVSDVIISSDPADPSNVGDLGDLSVTAESNEQVNATVSNAASSTTSALFDASSTGFGGVLASNKVNGSAIAYIDETGISSTAHPINIAGDLVVTATDNSGIYSNVKLVSAAIVTDDGGTGGLNTGITNPPTFTALGSTPTSFSNPQDLVTGNTVQLDAGYDTPTYTVGAPNEATVDLTTGDVIDDGGTLYRYTGTGQNGFDLTDSNITGDTTDFVTIGGIAGDTYTYIGSGASQVDLANTDYTDASNWKLVSNTFTALAQSLSPFSNTQTVAFGDLVQVDPGYATPDYTVGAAGEGTVNLRAGDVIQDGSTLYRYNGANQNNFALTDQAITADTTDFKVVGGQSGATYEYMGGTPTSLDLANTDYSNLGYWKLITTNAAPSGVKTTPPVTALGSNPSDFSNVQTVNNGDVITVDEGYDTPTYTIGSSNPSSTTLKKGDVIADGDTLYRYTGSGEALDLKTDPGLATNSDFTVIGGDAGKNYQFQGADGTSVDLANTDYTDATNWTLLPPGGGVEKDGAASNDASSTATPSNATAVGGILVLNDDRSATHAYVLDATISADMATVSALDKATIFATNDSTVTAGSSSLGSQSDNIALNGIIATNLIQNSATAEVTTSSITATDPATGGSPDAPVVLSIDAENDANIQATNDADTFGSNKSGGIVLAFNTIGLQSSNFLFNAVDALLGNNVVTAAFGDSPETNVTADASNSTLTADHGSVAITAFQSAKIDALTTNSTTSLGAALENASNVAVGAILATNQTNTFAKAYVDDGTTISAGGDVTIEATDKSQINATDTEVAASVLQSSAIKTPSLVTNYIDQLQQGNQFTSNSGTQTLTPGTIVYDDQNDPTGKNGKYYVYLGELGTNGLNPAEINLGTADYTIQVALQNNIPEWLPFTNSSLLADLPDFATVSAIGLNQGTGSSSTAVGAIFVLNTINASADAHASASTLDSGVGAGAADFGGGVLIEATNISTINATNTSTVTASNGQTGPTTQSPGSGLAVNATIATNNILGSTQAYASGGSITTLGTGGSLDVTATSNATIDAQNDATTDAKTDSVGVVLAFNTIGIKLPVAGFLENTVDALFGTDLAGEQPDQVYAYLSGTTASASDGIDVSASETSDITAEITNAETGLFSGGVSVAATVTLNRIATDVEAWVSGGTTTATNGDIDIEGVDQATITSTVLTPVIKLAVDFSATPSSGSSQATTVGVSIARNIVENTLLASAGYTDPISLVTTGAALTADDGNINVTANQSAVIAATSASAAIAVSISTSNAGAFAGAGAVAINTILGSAEALAQNATIIAMTGGADTGNVTVSAMYSGQITATVAALSVSAAEGDAVALGAAVALNLIGWRGTVADETEDSHDPIVLTANVNGGSINAGGAVSVTATSDSQINAITVAAAVAIGVSTDGGDSSGEESGKGDSPTSADEEGEGKTADGAGGETTTDEGQADGTTIDEGADNAGGAETNEGEKGGAAAGEAGNTGTQETGAEKGSATSTESGLGDGGGLLVGAGGIVNSAQAGQAASPTFTTASTQSVTDPQNVVAGNTVQLDASYDTPTFSVGGTGTTPTNSTVNPGDVVDDSGTLYRYIGADPLTGVDFSTGATPPDFTDTTNWAQIGGTTGDTYQYNGPSNSALDLNNQDYTNGSLWTDITGGSSSGGDGSSSAPSGDTPSLGSGLGLLSGGSSPTTPTEPAQGATNPDGATNPQEPATPTESTEKPAGESGSAASGEGTEGDGGGETSVSVSAAGVYTENKIATNVTASISNTASITTGSGSHNGLSVTASDTATINSFDGAASVSADFSDESGDSVTIGISIARNTIQNTVAASIDDAGQINAPNAPITVEATQASSIQATSLAAALSIAVGGENGLGVAGGGSLADNLIGTNTTATLSGTDVGTSGSSAGALTVEAADTSTIDATVAAFAANVTFGSEDGTGVGIGASLAHNRIGDGTDTGSGAVTASITDSSIFSGAIDVNATSQQDITATVAAVAVALSGGGESAVGVSGAGAFSFNEVAVAVSATIDGGSTDSITSNGVTVAAADTSTIEATVLAGSVAGGFGGEDSTDVAIGVSFARNSITDPVTASISDVPSLLTNGGAVSVTAQEGGTIDAVSAAVALSVAVGGESGIAVAGGGALAANFIDATTQAFISGTNLGATGHLVGAVTVSATDNSLISATIAAIAASAGIGGESGVGVAIGISLAYNEIGDATGFGSGEVKAYISGGSVDSSGLVSVAAASSGAISATTVAVAAALSGGGETGVGVAGAGVGVFNTISVDVSAYIDGGGAHSVASDGVSVSAADTARITSLAGAAAVSASFGGEAGVSVAVGLSIAGNIITDPVTAYITGVTELTTSGAAVSVTAEENATILATTVAAALSVAAGGEAGIAVAGGGAVAVNLVGAETSAYISNSTLGQTGHLVGAVTVTATDIPTSRRSSARLPPRYRSAAKRASELRSASPTRKTSSATAPRTGPGKSRRICRRPPLPATGSSMSRPMRPRPSRPRPSRQRLPCPAVERRESACPAPVLASPIKARSTSRPISTAAIRLRSPRAASRLRRAIHPPSARPPARRRSPPDSAARRALRSRSAFPSPPIKSPTRLRPISTTCRC